VRVRLYQDLNRENSILIQVTLFMRRRTNLETLESKRRLSVPSSPSDRQQTSESTSKKLVRLPIPRAPWLAHTDPSPAPTVSQGAKALISESDFPEAKEGTTYVAPQVLIDVDHSMKVMSEETFGPVVGIMKVRLSNHACESLLTRSDISCIRVQVKSDEEALKLINDSPYGLTCSIWTKDEAAFNELVDEIDTGTVFMNRCGKLLTLFFSWTTRKSS